MDEALEQLVRRRARRRCEYCHMPEEHDRPAFEIEHVVAKQHGGQTVAANLALACFTCNHHKGPNLAGVDPKSGEKVWMFNPRRHRWYRHFRWDCPVLVGRTAIGRGTLVVLGINLPLRVQLRQELIDEGLFSGS